MKRVILTALIAIGLTVGIGGTAQADTGCTSSGSTFCGKVVNDTYSIRNLTIIDELNQSKSLPPGYGSRSSGYYKQDVERYVVPVYHCALEFKSGGVTKRISGTYYVANQFGNYVVRLKKAGTC